MSHSPMPWNTSRYQKLRERQGTSILEPPTVNGSCKHPQFWTSHLQNCERINFCCFNPSNLWSVVAVLKKVIQNVPCRWLQRSNEMTRRQLAQQLLNESQLLFPPLLLPIENLGFPLHEDLGSLLIPPIGLEPQNAISSNSHPIPPAKQCPRPPLVTMHVPVCHCRLISPICLTARLCHVVLWLPML